MRFTPNKKDAVEADEESAAVVKAAAAIHAKKAAAADDEDTEPPKVRGKTKEADVKSVLDQWADDDE